jgi:Lamin Tail Domain/CHU_C Type IX secretion signal domain
LYALYVLIPVSRGDKSNTAWLLHQIIYSIKYQFYHLKKMKVKLTIVLLLLVCIIHAQTASRYDIVIDEIMADPSPAVGLPDAEFIELKNISPQPINLNGWRIGDAGGFASISSSFILQPDSFVIICTNSAVAALSVFGATLGVANFPSLDNDNDQLYIRSKEGTIIHAVEYSSGWYKNAVKKEGGWTLEMIDTKNPCSGFSNWTASNDLKGGTPGKKNSADALNKDQQLPSLLRAFATDSTSITLVFDEPLDSLSAVTANDYTISEGIGAPRSVTATAPLFNKVQLSIAVLLTQNKIYNITVNNVRDCAGNTIGAYNKAKLGWAPPVIDSFSIVINEVLFNPKPGGVDYVELYNRSDKIIDLKDCYISSRVTNGSIGSLKQISLENYLLFPQDYIVAAEDPEIVKRQYLARQPAAFIMIPSMPSYPDDKGDIVLLNAQGKILDELAYDAHWHFKLIDNDEGVALERIDYNKPTQDANNWHSAATDVGYGTPTYQNSQFRADAQAQGTITIIPELFSPDNDGFDDFTTIYYQFPEPGYVCNITIFDANGRPVRYLTRNALCGLKGYFRWDGLDEKNNKLPVGVYVVFTEIFNLQGKTKRFKNAVTLARRL